MQISLIEVVGKISCSWDQKLLSNPGFSPLKFSVAAENYSYRKETQMIKEECLWIKDPSRPTGLILKKLLE